MQLLTTKCKAEILGKFPTFMAYRCIYEPPFLPFEAVSDRCEALTGYSAEELAGLNFTDIVHPEDAENVKARYNAALSVGAAVEAGFRIIAKDGTEKRVLSRARVAKTDSRGMPSIIEGFLTDITKEFNMETALAANRESAGFFSKMGYGVRTPMNAILGLMEISLRAELPAHIREYSQLVRKSGHKLMVAMDNIMDYQSLEKGNLEIVAANYSLPSLVNDVINLIKEHLDGLEFHVFVDSKLPGVLVGDAGRLRQILRELLTNAVKFTEKGFVSLSIEGNVSGDTAQLVFTVEDTGRGIKESDRESLFKEFAQFDSKNVDGTGLGLYIAHNLVKMMGGEIHAASGYGVGSVFTVHVPQGLAKDRTPFCVIDNPGNKAVLILEQNPAYAASIARTIKNLGMKCTIVPTVSDLLDELSANPRPKYSHIFADASAHGTFLCNELSEACPDCNAIIVLLSNDGDTTGGYVGLAKPVFCLPVSIIFSVIVPSLRKVARARFTAPGARVLVVDDISANFTVANAFLLPYKMSVDFVENGEDAIKAVKLEKYDLIFIDHFMPAMDGAEATQIIRKLTGTRTDCKNVPIVALTAVTDHASKQLFEASGANDFLPKPIVGAFLNAAVEKWIPKDMQRPIIEVNVSAMEVPGFTIPGVDVLKGVINAGGSVETYLLVLKKYYELGHGLVEKLEDYAELEDMENFRIYAHSLAGLSASIGAGEISKAARGLEMFADKEDSEFVRANTPALLHGLETLLENIKPTVDNVISKPVKGTQFAVDKKKILLIDDTDAYLLMLDEILAGAYETLSSLDGEDGLETARLTMPDLILLDLIMPGMSGYEVLETLKADENLKHIPVILMSAGEDEDGKGASLGAAGFIQKPFEASAVKNAIESIIN